MMKLLNMLLKFVSCKGGGLFYIGGTDVLPLPLENEAEAEAIHMLKTEKEQVGKRRLIEHNLRLVVYIAKRFENTGIYIEDLVSIGTIGLVKAINTFNPTKNIKLATYASRCIENEILMYLRGEINGSRHNRNGRDGLPALRFVHPLQYR